MPFLQKARLFLKNADKTSRLYLSREDFVVAYWSRNHETHRNWGDAVNPSIIARVTGRTVVHYNDIKPFWRGSVITGIGSIVGSCHYGRQVIWGAGCKSESNKLNGGYIDVLACRGPLTRAVLQEQGVACDNLFGDPALLYPRLFPEAAAPRRSWKLGLIPHYFDQKLISPALRRQLAAENICVIDICGGIAETVQAVTACEAIASSSLHGIILADAYGIPSRWMKLSGKVGPDFKFIDYFRGAGRAEEDAVSVTDISNAGKLVAECRPHHLRVDLDAIEARLREKFKSQAGSK